MIKEIFRIRNYVELKWGYFITGVVFMVLNSLLNGISIFSIVPLMDNIIAGKKILLPEKIPSAISRHLEPVINFLNLLPPADVLKYLIIFIIISIGLKGLFSYLNRYYFNLFGIRLLTDIRNKMYRKMATLSMDFFVYGRAGEITSRLIYDVNLLRQMFVAHLPGIIFQGTLAVVYLVIIFTIDWRMSLLAILIFPPLLYPIYRTGKKLRKLGRKVQESHARIGNLIHEGVYGQQIIKAYNQEEEIINRFTAENERIFKTVMKATRRILLIGPFTEVMSVLGASGLLYYGAMKVMSGSLSSGFLILFFVALFSIISPLKSIGSDYVSIKQDSSALPRIFSFLDTKISVRDTGKEVFSGLKESIEFQGVYFSYGKKEVLKNVSFSLRKGERLGIVGPTGVGKTSLIGLLLRFYEPEQGCILIDGKDIREYKLETLRAHIGFVPQEPILFNDTLKRNIVLSEDPDMEKIRKAVEIAGIKDFIESLPDGYDTIAGERGTSFSGGQKQLVSVARAIYRDPEILILDEATASLDSHSEKILQEAMERIMKGRTVFIIAHRLSTLRSVDRIIVLKEGEIVEEGTHNQLIEKKGEYYHFWELQFH
ncbi:MAG: ABC transporter ATP-binding protein/permease [bacterium]|nr:ABC transporter ATP-binding protein/permease [bacterium]